MGAAMGKNGTILESLPSTHVSICNLYSIVITVWIKYYHRIVNLNERFQISLQPWSPAISAKKIYVAEMQFRKQNLH